MSTSETAGSESTRNESGGNNSGGNESGGSESPSGLGESGVERALRGQREAWKEVSETTLQITSRELPSERPKRILLIGVGSSFTAAKLTAYTLVRDKLRERVPVIACSSMSIPTEVTPTKGDWVFAFSHRGKTVPTRKALEIADRNGAFTIMVAGKGVEQPESVRFMLPTVEIETVEPHTISLTSAVCAVTTLLSGQKAAEEWEALRSIGDPGLETVRSRAGDGPTLLIGEWEGEWLAREGALKLMEMARLPVRAFGSEEFYHGPHFSHSDKDVVWYLGHPKDARASEPMLTNAKRTISMFGASPLAWVPALVELQWLSLGVALNRGINPDAK
jgi:fructoselysine-6-P-deglycase FrlB-like protein